VAPEAATGVVQRLVERAARRLQPLGEHVDGYVVEREGDEDGPLVRCQRGRDSVADRLEQLAPLRPSSGVAPALARTFHASSARGISRPCQERRLTLTEAW
jgi:hypothetical protein